MKRKRIVSMLLVATMAATLFAGCGNDSGKKGGTETGSAKEFDAFFAVPGTEINDDNEIQKIIEEKTGKSIEIKGAKENNLKNINVKFPLGTFTCVTGVSGSGKSTLVNQILTKILYKHVYDSKEKPGAYRQVKGLENIDKVVHISQNPIGRTPRFKSSNLYRSIR